MANNLNDALDKNTDVTDRLDPALLLPPGQAFTHLFVLDSKGGNVYWATLAQARAALASPGQVVNQKPIVSLVVQPGPRVVGQQLVLSATATDPDGQIVGPLEFSLNGTAIGTKSAPYDLPYTPTAAGSAVFSVKATDNAGDSTTATAAAVLITSTPLLPSTITFAPVGNKTVGDAGVTLSATSTNTGAGAPPITFTTSNATAVPVAGSSATFPAPGAAVLTASQAAGNGFAAGSASQTVTVSAGSTPAQRPTASLEISPDRIASGGSTTMFVDTSSPNSTVVSVKLYDDTTLITTLTTPPAAGQLWQYVYFPATGGIRQLTAVATDALGASSLVSNAQTLRVGFNRTISKTLPVGSPEQSDGIVFKADTSQELSFDALPSVAGNNVALQITDGSDSSVSFADLFDDYATKPYSIKRADGSIYDGKFPAVDTNFTA